MDPYRINENTGEDESIFSDVELPQKPRDVHIVNARILLFCIAAFQLYNLYEVWPFVSVNFRWVQHIILILISVGLALWTRHNPFYALLVALILWIAGNAVDFVQNGFQIGFTFLLFTLVLVVLALGLRNAREGEELRKTYGK